MGIQPTSTNHNASIYGSILGKIMENYITSRNRAKTDETSENCSFQPAFLFPCHPVGETPVVSCTTPVRCHANQKSGNPKLLPCYPQDSQLKYIQTYRDTNNGNTPTKLYDFIHSIKIYSDTMHMCTYIYIYVCVCVLIVYIYVCVCVLIYIGIYRQTDRQTNRYG